MRLHVVDGTFELFRAHYSKRPSHSAPDGRDVKATVGVASSMLTLLESREEAATHVAIAFDNPVESFRNDLFDGYKTGEGMEEVLRAQFDLVEEMTAALGLTVWPMDQWEADDALATAAARFAAEVDQVRIMSPDKDLGQSVQGRHVVQVDVIRKVEIDEDGVRERRGVRPVSIPDYLALVGDTADGIPGLAGFGAKSTALLLDHYGELEAIPDDPADWDVKVRGAARLGATLAAQREDAMLYKKLATLIEDVPLNCELADLEWRGTDREALSKICNDLGAPRILERAQRLERARG